MAYLMDNEGHQSSMRLIWSIVIMIIFLVWAYTCIVNRQYISFKVGDGTLIGLLFGGKVGQKYIEQMKEEK